MATNTSDFFTFSKTAGTAKNLQKPTDGGDNNLWGGYINVDLDTIVGAVNATSDLIADANQNELVDFTATGSAVNHVGITNAATGDGPTIEAKGDDSNVDFNVKPKGTGAILLKDGDGNELVKTSRTASAVNEITVANAATGNGPTLSATGDDTNIDLNIAGKGSGTAKFTSNIIIPDAGNIGSVSDPDAIAIASDGGLTFNGGIDNAGTISAGTIGSGVAGFTGIKALDIYNIDTAQTGTGDISHGSFTRGSSAIGMATFGSAMTLHNETAGVFTFPSTGIWKIEIQLLFLLNGDDRIIQTLIQIAPDGKTGTFVTRGNGLGNINNASSTTYEQVYGFCYTDVTNTDASSGTAVKFRISTNNSSTETGISTADLRSAVIFTRMGDT